MAGNQTSETSTKKANRMARSGSKPKPIPQPAQIATFIPPTETHLRFHPNATGGYRMRKGTL